MKRIALALLALVFTASAAWPQVVKEAGRKYSGKDNTPIGFYDIADDSTSRSVNGTYPLPTQEQAPFYTNILASSTPIISDTSAVGMADSSIVIDVSQYRSLGLIIRASGAANTFTRIAVSVREHIGGVADSNSTAPLYLRETFAALATVDSNMTLGSITAPTAVVAGAEEFVVVIPNTAGVAAKWGTSNLRTIPLFTRTGAFAFVQNISIRVRVLSAAIASPSIVVYLRGAS